ncbi:MAG: hypothetical protein QJR14_01935 [Bacillota bacterium]|nr:hypothetical protein [Bacillota bacterium]
MILDRIVEAKRRELEAAGPRQAAAGVERPQGRPPLSLERALRKRARAGRLGLIAECKRRSPSAGEIGAIPEPALLARRYQAGGAAAISVLTDRSFFGGQPGDLPAVREAVELPVLRKDFLIDVRQVDESVELGADAVLVIARLFRERERLAAMLEEVERAGLEALVEVDDEEEAAQVARLGARLIGVNNRDLATFRVEVERAVRVARSLRDPGAAWPPGVVVVAESGYREPAQVRPAAQAGVDAVLVGEALVRAEEPERLAAGFAAVERPGAGGRRGRTEVKICGLDSREATRAAVKAGADAVGWILLEGRRRSVRPEQVAVWAREVPPEVLRVGVFAGQSPDEVAAVARRCRLDAVQLHGGEDEAYVERLRALLPDAEVIRAVAAPERAVGEADVWLLDPGAGGGGRPASAESAEGFRRRGGRWWLAGGLDPANVAGLLERYRPGGVDVSSGVETGGRKDPARIQAFVAAVRRWEREHPGGA